MRAGASKANGVYSVRVAALFVVALTAAACGTSAVVKPVDANNATAIRQAAKAAKVPGVPQNVLSAFAGSGVLVIWSPPISDGGTPITNYIVIASTGEQVEVKRPATTAMFSGLVRGDPYTFVVKAVNSHGTGAASPQAAVTP
jgi:hypothetical protein